MFTLADMQSLLNATPFAPFRLHRSEDGFLDVPRRELALPGRRFAVIGLLDLGDDDPVPDRYTTVWYFQVTRVEFLRTGEALSEVEAP